MGRIESDISFIRCYFDSRYCSGVKDDFSELEVFFAKTKNIISKFSDLKNFITYTDHLRAKKFYFDEDRETYISCHALLRLILSSKLNKKPFDIFLINEIYNKPGIIGQQYHFNISHTREAFAIAISKRLQIGIDMENVNRNNDIASIIENYFSNREGNLIMESQIQARDMFFLLWTRKEALLKAIGVGIVANLSQIEVSEQENIIKKEAFNALLNVTHLKEYFIYSRKLFNYYISIATPQKVDIIWNQIDDKNIYSYLD